MDRLQSKFVPGLIRIKKKLFTFKPVPYMNFKDNWAANSDDLIRLCATDHLTLVKIPEIKILKFRELRPF